MGDMADYFLEQVLEEEELRLRWYRGEITIFEAFDAGIVDELGFEADASNGGYLTISDEEAIRSDLRSDNASFLEAPTMSTRMSKYRAWRENN